MVRDGVIATLYDKSVLWSTGCVNASEVVMAACDAVAGGYGGMAMAMLAGVHLRQADMEMPEYLPDALAEVDLPFFARGAAEGQAAWLVQMSVRLLNGELKPRELAAWAFGVIGYEGSELGQHLVALDSAYVSAQDIAEYSGNPLDTADLDADVTAEARRITMVVSSSSSRSAGPESG
jgi:hypothetical protein